MIKELILNIKEVYESKLDKAIKKEVIDSIITGIQPTNEETKTIYSIYYNRCYTERQLLLSPLLKAISDALNVLRVNLKNDDYRKRCNIELLDFFFHDYKVVKNRHNKMYYSVFLSIIDVFNKDYEHYKAVSEIRKKARAKRTKYNHNITKVSDERLNTAKELNKDVKKVYLSRFITFWSIIPRGFKSRKKTCENLFIGDSIINLTNDNFDKFINQTKSYYQDETKDFKLNSFSYLTDFYTCHQFYSQQQAKQILNKNWVNN